jgi:hypothetical protein
MQAGTTTLLTSPIQKGTDYDLVVSVQDLRGSLDPNNPLDDNRGVFAGFLDVLYNESLSAVEIEEIQLIRIMGDPTGGSFTLSFTDGGVTRTTTAITYAPLTESPVQIAQRIQTALSALSNIGAGNVEVVPLDNTLPIPQVSSTDFRVRFQGRLGDRDLSVMTANASGLTGGTGTAIQITELIKGVPSPAAFKEAFRPYTITAGTLQRLYINAREAIDGDNRMDEVGGVLDGSNVPAPKTGPKHLFRVRLNSLDAGTINFTGSVANMILPAHETLVLGRAIQRGLLPSEIQIVNPPALRIIEPFSAVADTFTVVEDSATTTLNVTANDTANNAAGDPAGALPTAVTIVSVSTPSKGGTVSINTGGRTLSYRPAANATGQETFTYTLRHSTTGVTDTTTVTVNITAVNDAPVNTVPGAQTINEDATLTFSGARTISVADVDVNEAVPGPGEVQVVLTVNSGAINLSGTNGLSFVSGNGSASVTLLGPLASVNAAMLGMTYQPNQDFNGSDTLQVATSDLGNTGSGGTKTDTDSVAITINAVNDAPVVTVPGAQGATETLLLDLPPIGVTDVDLTGANAQVTISVDGSGTLTLPTTSGLSNLAGNGTSSVSFQGTLAAVVAALNGVDYVPALGDAGTRTITVRVEDNGSSGSGGEKFDQKTITVNVQPLERPFARDDAATVQEDSTGASAANHIAVLANDFADSGSALFIHDFTQPAHGTVSLNDNGTPGDPSDDKLVYVPNADFFGVDTFTYRLNQAPGGKAPGDLDDDQTATVTVTVTPSPDPAVANDDSATTDEDVFVDIAVMVNDIDVDLGVPPQSQTPTSATHTVVIVTAPAKGSVSVNANGTVRYTPAANLFGSDSFTYRLNDGTFDSNVATVNITINPINDAPQAVNDSASVNEDSSVDIAVLANDIDVELPAPSHPTSPPYAVSIVSGPARGTAVVNADGTITYTPVADYFGSDSFTYKVSEGALDSNTATVTISVANTPDPPVANDDSVTTPEDTAIAIAVMANDQDVDLGTTPATQVPRGATHSVTVISGPSNGSVTINNATGVITYTPAQDFHGSDSFTYQLSDGTFTDTAVVNITVTPVNDAPVANNDAATTDEDAAVDIAVLANDLDVDLGTTPAERVPTIATHSITIVTQPARGTAAVQADGKIRYTPSANFNGPDSFTYRINDGQLNSNTATVSVTVNPVNDDPAANNDSFTSIANVEDQTHAVLANDSIAPDVGETLSITAAGSSHGLGTTEEGGTVEIAPDGKTILYTPAPGFEGTDTYRYTISDGNGGTDTATVTVNVIAYVPTDITGIVYIDSDNDNVVDANERRLAGVEIQIVGTDFLGASVDLTVQTDINGVYLFDDVVPGNYTIRQRQPENLRDGKDRYNTAALGSDGLPIIKSTGNDFFTIQIPIFGTADPSHTLGGNNFGEPGFVTGFINSTAFNAYTSVNNLWLNVVNATSAQLWQSRQQGWDNLKTASFNLATKTLTVEDEAGNIFSRVLTTTGSLPRYRIIGGGSTANRLVRIEGAASNFGWTLLPKGSPKAVADSYGVAEDQTLSVLNPALGVLANDSDPDLDPLSAVLVSGPSRGSLTLNTDGTFTYTPAADFHGSDSFTYRASDGLLTSLPATVEITVNPVNDDPTANDDSLLAINQIAGQSQNVLANDSIAPDVGETLSITAVGSSRGPGTTEQGGTVEIAPDGRSVRYTAPSPSFLGTDSYQYTVSDGNGGTATATVTLQVISSVPTDISGIVWFDNDNDGLVDASERRIANVEIRVHGTDFGGNEVDFIVQTDIDGRYLIDDLEPGSYEIRQLQPEYLRDGKDRFNTAALGTDGLPLINSIGNNFFHIVIPATGTLDPSHAVPNNNFGELGMDTNFVSLSQLLASTTNNGLWLAVRNPDIQLWHARLLGWNNLASAGYNTATNTLTVRDLAGNVFSRQLTTSGLPRYRVLGRDGSVATIIRIEGSAADFGWNLQPNGEGESGSAPADDHDSRRRREWDDYEGSIDRLMAAW